VTNLRSVASKSKCTISGLVLTQLMASLATEYLKQDEQETRDVGVSVLVDLRQFFNENLEQLNQAIGTVTVSLPARTFLLWSEKDLENWLPVAQAVASQLQTRMERGEAIRSSESASAPDTIELSNLGVINTPNSTTHLHTCRRFDGYGGVSCMTHTESGSGIIAMDDFHWRRCSIKYHGSRYKRAISWLNYLSSTHS